MTKQEWLTNQSRIVFNAGDSRHIAFSNTVSTPLVGPDFVLVKSTEAAQASPGIPVIFTVSITNSGNRDAEMTLYDLLQEGVTFVPNSVHRDGVPLPGADPVAGLDLGVVSIHQTIRITFQLVADMRLAGKQLLNQIRGEYTFQATDGRIVEGEAFSNMAALPVIVTGGPDITITLSVNKSSAGPGETLRYTAIVANIGDEAADVVLQPSIPKDTLFVPNSITVNGTMQSGIFLPSSIALGAIAPGKQTLVAFEATVAGESAVSPGQVLPNQVRAEGTYRSSGRAMTMAASDLVNPFTPSVSNPVSTVVRYPLFQLDLRAAPSVVEPEDVVHYKLCLTNIGNVSADATLIRLTIRQTSLVPGSIRINDTAAANPGPSGALDLGTVHPGSHVPIRYQAMISPLVIDSILRGFVTCQYAYELNEIRYNKEVISNDYTLHVEHNDE
ncbi:hypothetical protein PAESOLCIP111_06262 [Paenibacillus solanacearum]|uniref:DUF11 domain-containing protein n=1 Tax=Paenibacillus solanacearum TaxID=2048548 RepID=A0A916K938_9BACL|nr:DUF11 domain-containing protein [Paenibacillus solanacearum]CAG7651178.1 hypothetical protein PAESOLCIP111_06262 [Paenibacillus solanacearum]